MSQHHHEEKSYTNSFNISKSETFKSVVTTGPPGAYNNNEHPTYKAGNMQLVTADCPSCRYITGNIQGKPIGPDLHTTGISTSMSIPIITCFFVALLIILGLLSVIILAFSGVLSPEPKPTLAPNFGPNHSTEPFTTTFLPLINSTTLQGEISTRHPDKPNTTVKITCLHDLKLIRNKTTALSISSLYSKPDDWDWDDAPNLGNRGSKIDLQILSKGLDEVLNLNKILDWLRNRVENVTLDGRDLATCPNSRNETITPIILPEVIKLEIFNVTGCLINKVLRYWQVPEVLDVFVYCTDKKDEYGKNLMRLLNPKTRQLNNYTVHPKHCHEINI
ncbi:hypothetical protein Fcan01_15471 [Folsomia candida]|uniref:Uncharacterized protein n=1 Tax=Folsomia candida TaxID=158441 RepID=A0A226DXB4_FOLCA|nr:hypothetical protein Fcan01_15471 [Folsomia candida]